MPAQTVFQDPSKNAYQVGIAYRLRVEPQRVNITVRAADHGGFLFNVAVDGRDLNAAERRIVSEYLEEELKMAAVVVDERAITAR